VQDLDLAAPRPAYSPLTSLFASDLGLTLPPLDVALKEFLDGQD
jgi:dTDP-4-dehydrorhamnose reductase